MPCAPTHAYPLPLLLTRMLQLFLLGINLHWPIVTFKVHSGQTSMTYPPLQCHTAYFHCPKQALLCLLISHHLPTPGSLWTKLPPYFSFCRISYSWGNTVYSFSDWLLPVSNVHLRSSKSFHDRSFILTLNNILLSGCNRVDFSIHYWRPSWLLLRFGKYE